MKKSSKEIKQLCVSTLAILGATVHSLKAGTFNYQYGYELWFSFDGNKESSEWHFIPRNPNRIELASDLSAHVLKRKNIIYSDITN